MAEQEPQNPADKHGWRARRDANLRANLLKRKSQAKARDSQDNNKQD
jgi:hypothetical protein